MIREVHPGRSGLDHIGDKKKGNCFFMYYKMTGQLQLPIIIVPQREHPALQISKHEFFKLFFLHLWVMFALQDPDTDPLT
jgi:hypothetical protein